MAFSKTSLSFTITIESYILFQFLDVLKNIEEEKIDQHEGSFKVGKLLKEIYVDSALRKAKKLDELYPNDKELENKGIDINWKTFKQSHKN